MVIRERRESDLALCLELALAVKARDGYPPRGPVDIEHFLAPPEQLAAWVAEDGSALVGHVAVHIAGEYSTTRVASDFLRRPSSDLALSARLFVEGFALIGCDDRPRQNTTTRERFEHA